MRAGWAETAAACLGSKTPFRVGFASCAEFASYADANSAQDARSAPSGVRDTSGWGMPRDKSGGAHGSFTRAAPLGQTRGGREAFVAFHDQRSPSLTDLGDDEAAVLAVRPQAVDQVAAVG